METGWFRLKLKKREPEELDIHDLGEMLGQFENLLFSQGRKQRPHASFKLVEGCTELYVTTRIEEIRTVQDFLAAVKENRNLSILDRSRVEAIQYFQDWISENNDIGEFETSANQGSEPLTISGETHYRMAPHEWVEAEIYLYGEIISLGGKGQSKIRLESDQYGLIYISVPAWVLASETENRVYKRTGVLVKAKQNLSTGDIANQAEFIEFIDYSQTYDEAYIQNCLKNSARDWVDVDNSIVWLHSIRGTDATEDSVS